MSLENYHVYGNHVARCLLLHVNTLCANVNALCANVKTNEIPFVEEHPLNQMKKIEQRRQWCQVI